MRPMTDAELRELNNRDFVRCGCAFWPKTAAQIEAAHGLRRVFTGDLVAGGAGGCLLGYVPADAPARTPPRTADGERWECVSPHCGLHKGKSIKRPLAEPL
jgi:hypothetical protein